MSKQTEKDLTVCEPVQTKAPADTRWWDKYYVHVVLILAVGSVVYSGILSAPFVFDDIGCVLRNPAITDVRFITDTDILKNLALDEDIYKNIVLRPVPYLTFAVNHCLHGYEVFGYHLFNVIIHLLNSLLVYLITRLTLDSQVLSIGKSGESALSAVRLVPLFSALLFVGHPLQIQAVTYITQRFTSLAAFFFFLSLALYILSGLSQQKMRCSLYYTGSLIAACIAMKTKEIAFTLPVIILIYEYTFFSTGVKQRIVKLAPFMMTMLIIPVTVIKLDAELSPDVPSSVGQSMNLFNYTEISQLDYLVTQFRVVVTYIRLLFMPVNQNLDYDITLYTSFFHPSVALSFTLVVTLLGAGLFLFLRASTVEESLRTKLLLIAFGLMWFFVTLTVESSILPLDDLLVEQRVYLPSVGFIWAVITTTAVIFEKRLRIRSSGFAAVAGSAVIALSTAAHSRNGIWKDPITLWEDTAHKSPRKARPHFNLGAHYIQKRMFPDALDAFTTGMRLDPENIEANINIANIYFAMHRFDEAEAEYWKAMKVQPDNERIYNNLGRLYFQRNDYDRALTLLQRAVQLNQYFPEACMNLAELYEAMGRSEQSASEYRRALKLVPGDPVIIARLKRLTGR